MNNKNLPAQIDDEPAAPPPQEEAPAEERPAPPPPEPTREPRRRGGGVAWLALLLAIAVAGWNGYQYQERERRAEAERALLNEQARRLSGLERASALVERELSARARSLDERQRALEEGLTGVRTLAGLHGRNGWVTAEAEYLIRLAGHRLHAAHDAATAAVLLKDADGRLAELGDPALHTARTLLAADIAALNALPPDPVPAHAAALTRLMDQVEALPLPIPRAPANSPRGTPKVPDDRWQWRAWVEETKQWLQESVVLRRDGERAAPLIAPAERYLLGQNLRLTLQTARLALYRGDAQGFRDALGQARRWVVEHFDGAAGTTRALLRELARLEQAPLSRELPALDESLKALAAAGAANSITRPADTAEPQP